MLTKPEWPVFNNHEEVVCYSCKERIKKRNHTHGSATRFEAGHGQFNQKCQCGVTTWYDIRRP